MTRSRQGLLLPNGILVKGCDLYGPGLLALKTTLESGVKLKMGDVGTHRRFSMFVAFRVTPQALDVLRLPTPPQGAFTFSQSVTLAPFFNGRVGEFSGPSVDRTLLSFVAQPGGRYELDRNTVKLLPASMLPSLVRALNPFLDHLKRIEVGR
jgi:hypothetical protein